MTMDYYIICHLAENPSKLFIYPGEHAVVAVAAAAQLSAYIFLLIILDSLVCGSS